MPAAAHQSNPRITTPAAGGALGAPSPIAVLALAVGDVATVALAYSGLAGLAFRVIDAHALKVGATAAASANTDQVRDQDGNAITNVLNMQVADEVIVRAGEINDDNDDVPAGEGLQVNHVKAGQNAACIIYVKIALT